MSRYNREEQKKRRDTPEYKEHCRQYYLKRKNTPEYKEVSRQYIEKRRKDPAFRKKCVESALRRAKTRRIYLDQIKSNIPCKDCGKFYPPCVMDFDHLGDKEIDVSHMLTYTFEKIDKEIAKCEIVCANCHRLRTRNRWLESC